MYLDGQLPLGPDSSNLGGQSTPGGNSALDGAPSIALTPSFAKGGPLIGNAGDPSANGQGGAETFFLLDGAGPVVINPSLVNGDGVVQAPYTEPKNPGYKLQSYGECGSYGADGSLVSLRTRTLRTGLSGMCQSGSQSPIQDTAPDTSIWGLFAVLGVIAFLGDK